MFTRDLATSNHGRLPGVVSLSTFGVEVQGGSKLPLMVEFDFPKREQAPPLHRLGTCCKLTTRHSSLGAPQSTVGRVVELLNTTRSRAGSLAANLNYLRTRCADRIRAAMELT